MSTKTHLANWVSEFYNGNISETADLTIELVAQIYLGFPQNIDKAEFLIMNGAVTDPNDPFITHDHSSSSMMHPMSMLLARHGMLLDLA